MSRTSWIAVLLLVASNAVWCFAWIGRDDPASEADFGGLLDESLGVGSAEDSSASRATAARDGRAEQDAAAAAGLLLPGADEPGLTLGGHGGGQADADAAGGPGSDATRAEEASPAAAAARKQQRAALEHATATLRKIAQVKDAALREEGLAELADTLTGGEPMEVEYALGVLHQLRSLGLGLDLADFRHLVLAHVDAETPGVRRSALYALRAAGGGEGDLRLVLAAADDPDPLVRSHASRLLRAYGRRKLEGEAADAVVRLLADENSHVFQGTLRGLGGVDVGPEVERALLEIAARPEQRHTVLQFALVPLREKSRAVVDAMFTYLGDEDHRIRRRAHEGLQRGVPKTLQPYVAKRYAGHLEELIRPRTQYDALKIIAGFGDVSLVPEVERFAENELVSAPIRDAARKTVEHLRRKKSAR